VIWDLWFELWAGIRNGEVHGTTTAARAQAQERRELNRQLNEIFALRGFMEPPVQALATGSGPRGSDAATPANDAELVGHGWPSDTQECETN
jgi:hypothetical protein